MSRAYESWGRIAQPAAAGVRRLYWRHEPLPVAAGDSVLPYGMGRSYGDSCLNAGGFLLDTRGLDRFIAFDTTTGLLEAEAGVTLDEVLQMVVPRGWFLPVTPGTKYVTLGGAVANDVHGKNHHRAGTFGHHVLEFSLRRSSGELIRCSRTQHQDMFRATIGGLGLTGLIVSVQLRLIPIASDLLLCERLPMADLDEFFALSRASAPSHAYTVAWIDAAARGRALGRGVFMRGNHAPARAESPAESRSPSRRLAIPIDAPSFALNRWSISVFNRLYYRRIVDDGSVTTEHFERFFYPLDAIANWNRLYGRRGFYQYQCLVPEGNRAALREVLDSVARYGEPAVLSVLKVLGDIPSPGMLSFARPGATLALDFANRGQHTLDLFKRLDDIVLEARGAIYPAKDARMSGEAFRRSFPRWQEFGAFVDPAFSSSFWRRVNG